MKKIIGIIAGILLLQTVFAQRQIDRVAAIVGQEVILVSDIEAQYKLMESQTGGKMPQDARCIIFDQLLSNALILSEAEKDSILANESEIEQQMQSRITEILRYMNNDPEQFKLYYGRTPEEVKDEMRDDMRKQLVIQKMSQNIMQSVVVTPKEVKEFFINIPKDSLPYFNSEVELGEIVVKPKVNPDEDRRAKEKAEELRKRIVEQGADFAELAKKYSDDKGTAVRGGDLGITSRGSFVPEFEAAAYSLDKMEISEVIKSEFGYHIIQLIDRLGNNISTRHILIKPQITIADQEAAKIFIDSIRSLILLDSFTFDKAVQRFSEDDFSKTRAGIMMNTMTGEAFWELGDLDPEVYFAIDKLKLGEISAPIEFSSPYGESIFKIVKLRNKSKPHVANMRDDYSRIQQAAVEEKKSRHIMDWVDKKITRNYVEIKLSVIGDYSKHFLKEDGTPKCSNLERWMWKKP
jgi:peptidyl-prolyl cis-trans isomerase SurA